MRTLAVLLLTTLIACQKQSIDIKPIGNADFLSKGRIGVLSQSENLSASFIFSAQADIQRLELWGPVGMGHAVITSADGFAAMTDSNGRYYRSDNIDDLIKEQIGYPVPASSLRYWLSGTVDPLYEVISEERYENGGLKHLEQADWRVDYGEWSDETNRMYPVKIKARDDERNVRISIKIDEWNAQ